MKSQTSLDYARFGLWQREGRGTFDGVAPSLLRRAMNECVTQRQREFITEYYFQGLNIPAIAQKHSVAKSTVSRTIRRGEIRLRSALRLATRQ